MAETKRGLTYAQAGVDIDAGNRMVELIKPLVKATARRGADAEIGGFYYVLAGEGTVRVGSESAPIKPHDAVPLNFNQTRSFEATGTAPLELMAIGIVKDAARRFQIVGRNPYIAMK